MMAANSVDPPADVQKIREKLGVHPDFPKKVTDLLLDFTVRDR